MKIPISACLVLKSSSLSSNINSTSISGFNCINSWILGVSQCVPKLLTVVIVIFHEGLLFWSLNEVSTSLTTSQIFNKIELMHHSLVKDFNVKNPKIALLGLNPHSGDMGLIGKEEIEIISQTIKKANQNNYNELGPYSADGFFESGNYQSYDGILGMYHK
mgnify:CR=1 FL=1